MNTIIMQPAFLLLLPSLVHNRLHVQTLFQSWRQTPISTIISFHIFMAVVSVLNYSGAIWNYY